MGVIRNVVKMPRDNDANPALTKASGFSTSKIDSGDRRHVNG